MSIPSIGISKYLPTYYNAAIFKSRREEEMFEKILEILERFHGNRTNGAISHFITYMWFCAIITSTMFKTEPSGIVISTLKEWDLDKKYYSNVDDVFRSNAIDHKCLEDQWGRIVGEEFTFYKVEGMIVYTNDGVLNPKEGRRGSTVTRLSKESGTQSKPSSFFGASTGSLNIMTCSEDGRLYPVPLKMWFSQGFSPMVEWENTPCSYAYLPTEQQEIMMTARDYSSRNEDAVILADRATMSINSFERVEGIRDYYENDIWLVTCCKSVVDAYEYPDSTQYKGVGRHALLGDKVDFSAKADKDREFKEAKVYIYGKWQVIKYCAKKLLWQRSKRLPLLFVFCIMEDGRRAVFATDKLDMDPVTVVKLYTLRFLCEEGFKSFKHTFFGFDYHFWSKSMPWNSFVRKSGEPHPLESVTDKASQEKIMAEFKASSLALQMACIAQGLAQLLAQKQEIDGIVQEFTIKRTNTKTKVSEHDVCNFLAKNRDEIMKKYKHTNFIRFIKKRQRKSFKDRIASII